MGSVNDERSPMTTNRFATKPTLVVGAVLLAVCVGAGAAIAATKDVFDPKEEQKAFQEAVAEKLGVTTTELQNAYKAAALERLDAAVAADRITETEAAEIRTRIQSGDFLGPLGFGFGFGPHFHVEGGPWLDGAADYLGLTEAELHQRLRNGQTLAEIAEAEGKSVSGLKQALLASAREKLDNAVQKGEITSAQRDEILGKLESGIDDLVNGTGPRGPGLEFHHRFGGPMDGSFVPLAPPNA
jgi:hypothetical protein